jgi:hypothetical protein
VSELKAVRELKASLLEDLAEVRAEEDRLLNSTTRKVAEDTAYFERMLRLLKTIKGAKDCRVAVRGDSGGWVNVIPASGVCGEALARIAQYMVLERITTRAINAERADLPIIIPSEDLLPGVE